MVKTVTNLFEFDEKPQPLPSCPNCGSNKAVVKFGKRTGRSKTVPRFKCNVCNKTFTNEPVRHTMHPSAVIAGAITQYNLGYSVKQVASFLKRRYNAKVPEPTIYDWTRRYAPIATFIPMRNRYDINPRGIIYAKKLYHVQIYEFKYHQLKLNIAAKTFPQLKRYLLEVASTDNSKTFTATKTRCSTFKADLQPSNIRPIKSNNAIKMTRMALSLVKHRAKRHEAIEKFFIINDSSTFAVEVPVYVFPEEAPDLKLTEPLTGHIDIIQYRNGKIYIMDYKPDQDPASASTQLKLYARALSRRAGIPMANIATAAFNEAGYVEFQ